jgi:hypothetical protein
VKFRSTRRLATTSLPWLAAMSSVALGACPLEVVGTWKLAGSSGSEARLVSFQPDGWANVLNGPGEQSPGDIAAQVSYRLMPPQQPRRIEFQSRRGNDMFGAGTTSWEITSHNDDSFTALRTGSTAGKQGYWMRVQTHRYFLTFAARSGAAGDGAAFVMWTTLDGKKTQYDALGSVQQGGGKAHFGKIPDAIARSFATQGDPTRDVMMRIELNEAEYRRTREVHREWTRAPVRSPAGDDPDARALRLIEAMLLSVNRCSTRIQPSEALAIARAAGAQVQVAPSQPLEMVRTMRRTNDRRHVPDKAFPAGWKPAELT